MQALKIIRFVQLVVYACITVLLIIAGYSFVAEFVRPCSPAGGDYFCGMGFIFAAVCVVFALVLGCVSIILSFAMRKIQKKNASQNL
ncbi:MAG: hypothetical protein A3C84_05150 [Candidatus Ryanbacteria bacterium RIFCSPHIGHO2_02_FULL_48_12]|uniref:Uncharacterized protein n=1 Tax=Candidatus Ryanbacteria bacterium RIFCSPHIGHO2_01_FULL_48_27 TaxID=1802115 RepID=A0A1G2G7S9_9BACT|nr:MAG: hypothetical protein A2756_05975 [Candidatus Ryanbacteria bacterium RIFCSPHIGHO2_01_FULL_48_27]OGZ49548.1 MAG: hypothetical protein A3C84_05150 [Candidatus Ryanbacteria bacterium RIFCSPHIGHO2_02_FULL_48_12]